MLVKETLQAVIRTQEHLKGPALSVYLDVDQSKPRNRNREFEASFRGLLRPLQESLAGNDAGLERFGAETARVSSFLKDYKPDAKTLVLFSTQDAGLFWTKGVHVPIRESAEWSPTLLLRPLIEAFDEYEGYLIVLADRERARLFLSCLGEIEELAGLVEPDVRRRKTVGTDHWRSQANFQRRAEEHTRSHVQDVVQAVLDAGDSHNFDRLILAGGLPVRAQIEVALPRRMRRKVAASIDLAVEASPEEVRQAIQGIEEEVERAEEVRVVEDLITVTGKGGGAILGLDGTLDAVVRGQVHKLVYAEDYSPDRGACLHCGVSQPNGKSTCARCGGQLEPSARLLDAVVARVERDGGKIELVKGKARDLMTAQDGAIGAFLRF